MKSQTDLTEIFTHFSNFSTSYHKKMKIFQIKDLNGEVASVFKNGDFYNVRETLTQEQSDRQVEISRLEKLRKMVKDDVVRNQLTWKIVGLKQIR